MKINNIVRVSTLALILGTAVTFVSFEAYAVRREEVSRAGQAIEVNSKEGSITTHNIEDTRRVIHGVKKCNAKLDLLGVKVASDSELSKVIREKKDAWTENFHASTVRYLVPGKSSSDVLSALERIPSTDAVAVVKFGMRNPRDVVAVVKIVQKAGGIVQTDLPKAEGDVKTGENVLQQIKQDVNSGQSTIKSDENTLHNFNNDVNDAPSDAGNDIKNGIVGGLKTAGTTIKSGIVSVGNDIASGAESAWSSICSIF